MKLELEIPENTANSLNSSNAALPQEFRTAAAIKWYELGKISQEKASEIAGLSRSEFISRLGEYSSPLFKNQQMICAALYEHAPDC